MRNAVLLTIVAIVIGAIYYLYHRQLGAIPFLLISLIFFTLAYQQLSKAKQQRLKKKELMNEGRKKD